jgi:hypothetical protein
MAEGGALHNLRVIDLTDDTGRFATKCRLKPVGTYYVRDIGRLPRRLGRGFLLKE